MFKDNEHNLTDADFVGVYLSVCNTNGDLKEIAQKAGLSVDQVQSRMKVYMDAGVQLPPLDRQTVKGVATDDREIDVARLNEMIMRRYEY